MVSSSGDADLRIIYAGDAHPVNIGLIPSWKDFFPAFKAPAFNTVNGVHYGVSLQWGPNVLMYNKKSFSTAPTSWNGIYNPKYQGQVTVPDNPIQIADAASSRLGPAPGPGAVSGAGAPRGRGEPDQRWSRVSAALWRRPWARATLLLTPALAWFVLIYLAALAVLLITAFWRINAFTTNIERVWNIDNFTLIFGNAAYRAIVLRTAGMAAGVTVVDAIIALPFAYYMARIASGRTRTLLYVAILLPLWASYLARVYAWLLIFTHDGVLNWTLGKLGAGSVSLIYTNWAVFIVFCYVWLPFMIIPVYAALERIPGSQIEASQDLGARTWRTTRLVILPLVLPGLVAGSIFTFSLTLGDFITPILIGGAGSTFMGNVIEQHVGISNNVPFAAAMALIPMAIMAVYMLGARALGAFKAL